ncbi:MAG TPA: hypothetical protein VEC19_08800 [Usitatibacter sp.]|nr:hypothetical protein [Usitatibacter sp.]
MAKCQKCELGPKGIAGHDDLYALAMGGGLMRLKCSACGTVWARRYAGASDFTWEESGSEHLGAVLPRR